MKALIYVNVFRIVQFFLKKVFTNHIKLSIIQKESKEQKAKNKADKMAKKAEAKKNKAGKKALKNKDKKPNKFIEIIKKKWKN